MSRALLLGIFCYLLCAPIAQAHWRSQPSGASHHLRAASGSNSQIYIVGDNGTILTSKDGITWSTSARVTKNQLNAILAIDDARAIAIGDFGTILLTKDAGLTWSVQTNDLYQDLNAIFRAQESIYIAGSHGLLLRSTDEGNSWTTLRTDTTNDLNDIWGSSPDNVYAVGKETVLQSKDFGKTWAQLRIGSIDNFVGIWGPSANEIYLIEEKGHIYSTQNAGKTWSRIATEQDELFDIVEGANHEPLVVSPEGILRSTDKGKTWPIYKQNSSLQGGFHRADNSLYFVGDQTILTFGESTTQWSQIETQPGGLRAIWGNKQNGLFVSSFEGALLHSTDGSAWKKISNKETPKLVAFWGADSGELFAIAADNKLYLSTDQGATWAKQKLPNEKRTHCIWGSGSTIFVAGDSIFASNDTGKTWKEQSFPKRDDSPFAAATPDPEIFAVWGSSKENVYLVGNNGFIFHTTDGGTNWKRQDSKISNTLRAIWGSGAGDVYAVGDDGAFISSKNGSSWRTISGLSPYLREDKDKEDLNSIWGVGNDIYIGGDINGRGLILRSTDQGATWSTQRTASYLTMIWGLSADAVYALSMDGEILQNKKGNAWELREYPNEMHSNALWQSPKGALYAVGARGEIARSKDLGKTWEQQKSGVALPLYGVWGVSDDELVAVGSSGLILTTKNGGTTWERSTTTESLFALYGDSKKNLYAVGAKGLILHSTDKGKSWSKQASGTNQALYCLWGDGATLYAAGSNGTIVKTTNGASWSKIPTTTKETIFGLWSDNKNIFAVGDKTLLQSKDGGKTWSNSSSARDGLRDIWGTNLPSSSGFMLYAIGGDGEILSSRDNGATWALQSTGTKDALSTVIGLADGSVMVAGDQLYTQDQEKTWAVSATSKHALYGLTGDAQSFYAVGHGIVIPVAASRSASIQRESNSENLLSIFSTNGSVYVVGYSLVVEKKKLSKPKSIFLVEDKSGWAAQTEVNWMMRDVWVNDAGAIYVVGESFVAPMPEGNELIKDDNKEDRKGVLLTSQDRGKTWGELALDFIPRSVWGDSDGGLYLAGEKGVLSYKRGPTYSWEIQQSNVKTMLTSLWGDDSTMYAVGEDGVILRTNDKGKTWKHAKKNTHASLTSIWGDKSGVYAVGEAGVVLYSKDSGKTWEQQPSPYALKLNAVWAVDNEVYAVGENEDKEGVLMKLQ